MEGVQLGNIICAFKRTSVDMSISSKPGMFKNESPQLICTSQLLVISHDTVFKHSRWYMWCHARKMLSVIHTSFLMRTLSILSQSLLYAFQQTSVPQKGAGMCFSQLTRSLSSTSINASTQSQRSFLKWVLKLSPQLFTHLLTRVFIKHPLSDCWYEVLPLA